VKLAGTDVADDTVTAFVTIASGKSVASGQVVPLGADAMRRTNILTRADSLNPLALLRLNENVVEPDDCTTVAALAFEPTAYGSVREITYD